MTHTRKSDDLPEPPPPDPRRRELCGVGAMALFLSACGGSDMAPGLPAAVPAPPPPAPTAAPPPGAPTPAPSPPAPTPAPPPPALSCGAIAITGNHGHALAIPSADVDSPIDKVYSIMGAADHNHLVTLTVAQLGQIKGKTPATVMSTMGPDGHTHLVTMNCA